MSKRRSFLRARAGEEDFAEITWTRRALEIVEGRRGTPGKVREVIAESETEVLREVEREVTRLTEQGFFEQPGAPALRVDPGEYLAAAIARAHTRTCAVPVFAKRSAPATGGAPTASDALAAGSRRGGRPWLPAGGEWPTCPSCTRHLAFVLQVALSEVGPAAGPLPTEGLLQLFACDSACWDERGGWEPFSGTTLVRVVDSARGNLAPMPAEADDDADFLVPEERVERWSLLADTPCPATIERLMDVDADSAIDAWELLKEQKLTNRWEKMGGWPAWAQEEATIACRGCGAFPMAYVMQLESTLVDLRTLANSILYVLRCTACAAMTTVQQR